MRRKEGADRKGAKALQALGFRQLRDRILSGTSECVRPMAAALPVTLVLADVKAPTGTGDKGPRNPGGIPVAIRVSSLL